MLLQILRSLLLTSLMVMTTALCSPLAGQDRSRVWLGLGLGSGARADGASGFAVMGEVVYQIRAHHFAVRGFGAADSFGTNADEFGEIGLLYGRAAKRRWGHASLAGGLALTGVSSCPAAPASGCTTLGVPIVAEAALRLASIAGVGVQAFANLNPKSIYGGFVVFLQLGWLPTDRLHSPRANRGASARSLTD